jgi:hypothetical protein
MPRPASVQEPRWRALVENARRFVAQWASQATELGWDSLSLFGCHPTHPGARHDLKGLVWFIGDGEIIAMTATTARLRTRTGATQLYRRAAPRPGEPVVAAWAIDVACAT